ncbi:hypothetical protein N9F48_02505 [Akkermansiaceae bacterium]|nr:hypothetical protein [Akkermansiaceae bacterium]MDA8975391.1 hypothetical protein [Akkermansiaceae bacterium]MDB4369345.1 hypothetical protein [Akkermansiaceae bacterium]MDB4532558.1 hypothetical protein [bacterium]MDB4546735.1 hypothetical protein [Akkermansiaceae bacterium]
MTATKTTCPDCGTEFLQSTADSNDGACLKCKPRKKGINHESVASKIEVSMRLLLAFFFGFVFAGLGYGAGAVIWAGIGVILAIACFPIGFVYGYFCQEINIFIRGLIRTLLPFD